MTCSSSARPGCCQSPARPTHPAKAGISVADIAAGMYAFSGVLSALYERERTGRGSRFDVAMLDALGEWMGAPYYYHVYGGNPVRRSGARHVSISPYGPYATADGQVFIGLQNDREWAVLCDRVLGTPELTADERFSTNTARLAHDQELTVIIERTLAALDLRGGHGAARRGGHRQRPDADSGRVRRASAAGRPRPLARGWLAGRPGACAAAADHSPGSGGGNG